MKKYDIAAYVWPAYTGDEPKTRIFWEEGYGEWQTVKNSKPKANGYNWGRKPLWGYVNEADPYVMEMEIEAAVDHGVNVFIYDWYWYDNSPFLENCLNDGFLKAKNCNKMKFYIMWANHDVNYTWDIRNSKMIDRSILYKGAVTFEQFKIVGKRWIEQYFNKENYYTIDGKPVVSIYDLNNLVKGLGGLDKTKEAIGWLQEEAKKAGLKGVHLQFVRWNGKAQRLTGVDGEVMETTAEIVEDLGFDSLTHYQYCHFTDIRRDYNVIMEDVKKQWQEIEAEYNIPYYPHISLGWDNNPRFKEFIPYIMTENTPENIETALREAKAFADKNNVNLITVNSWNEWTETSYLQPDNIYGYGYLQAVKKVFKEEQ